MAYESYPNEKAKRILSEYDPGTIEADMGFIRIQIQEEIDSIDRFSKYLHSTTVDTFLIAAANLLHFVEASQLPFPATVVEDPAPAAAPTE